MTTQFDQWAQLYRNAEYHVMTQPSFIVKIGVPNEALNRIHQRYQVECSVIITACNPRSQLRTQLENSYAQRALKQELDALAFRVISTEGRDPFCHWPVEAGYLVLGCDWELATRVGRKFGQNAVVSINKDTTPDLVWCGPL